MAIRRVKKRKTWRWCVDYRDGKGRRRRRFFAGHLEAVTFSQTITMGKPSRRQGPTYTIRNLCDGYVNGTEAARTPHANRTVIYQLSVVVKAFEAAGVRWADELLDDGAPMALRQALEAHPYAPHSIKGFLSTFRSAVRYAAVKGILPPLAEKPWKVPEPDQVKRRWLTKDEIEELLGRLQGHPLQLPCALGIYEGLRREEVILLRGGDVDLGRNELTVRKSKTHKWRVLKLHPTLRAYLPAALPPNDAPLCLNTKGKAWTGDALRQNLERRIQGLGPSWQDVSFHTLRHTCASQMAQSGRYTLYQIGQFLGHANLSTTQRYAHLLPGQVEPNW